MNLQDSVTSIMSRSLKVVAPEDKLQVAKDLFGTYQIHHLPVVKNGKLVGILSKTDYLYFMHPASRKEQNKEANELQLQNYTVEDAMSKRVVFVYASNNIKTALEILSENLFHALPVMENGKLVGLVTTHDIVFALLHPKKLELSGKSAG